jgi:3-oxoacyl-[acyl-carrier-protein] synthase III
MAEIGIGSIAVSLPPARLETAVEAPRLGIEAARLEQRLGFRFLARKADVEDTSDLALSAMKELISQGLDPAAIDCLCVVTQNPDGGGIPPVSSIVHGRLNLPNKVAAFDLAHGCAGYVYGLAITKAFMEAQAFATGVLITADPYSKVVDPNDRQTALIFGDAATATILTEKCQWHIGRADFGTAGMHADALRVGPAGYLSMNGQRVARFCATAVPLSIRRALELNGLDLDEVDEILLHQASRYIVDTVGAALGARDKTPFYAADYGNVVSSSLPLALARHVPNSVHRLVVSGFGVGLSWASTVLTRAPVG